MLAYICKVGPVSETIRLDRRPRRNADGTYTTRLPETWEECHEVLCELEGARAGTKALAAARAGGIRQKQPKTIYSNLQQILKLTYSTLFAGLDITSL